MTTPSPSSLSKEDTFEKDFRASPLQPLINNDLQGCVERIGSALVNSFLRVLSSFSMFSKDCCRLVFVRLVNNHCKQQHTMRTASKKDVIKITKSTWKKLKLKIDISSKVTYSYVTPGGNKLCVCVLLALPLLRDHYSLH